jgi:hypothetical protein
MLTMYIAKEQNRWDEYLSQIMMAYRSSKQSSTGQTPNMLMLGREVHHALWLGRATILVALL